MLSICTEMADEDYFAGSGDEDDAFGGSAPASPVKSSGRANNAHLKSGPSQTSSKRPAASIPAPKKDDDDMEVDDASEDTTDAAGSHTQIFRLTFSCFKLHLVSAFIFSTVRLLLCRF